MLVRTSSIMEEALDLIASFHESSEYPVLCERIKAEMEDRLSKSQTHYANILKNAEAKAKVLSEPAATALTKILDLLAKLPSDEISMILGLLV